MSYVPSTKGIQNTDTYVFIPTKYTLSETVVADRATVALEEFTDVIKKSATKTMPLKQTRIKLLKRPPDYYDPTRKLLQQKRM